MDELRNKIIGAAIEEFSQNGLKFTMDDIARDLAISKKTIYTVFSDKESLFYHMVDYSFDKIKEAERAVLSDLTLSTIEKLRRVLTVLPDVYTNIDLSQLYLLKAKYPKTYMRVEKSLETGWEATIALLNKGMEEGIIKKIDVIVFKTMYEATLEQFFQRDILIDNKISYQDALKEVVDILIEGIAR